MERDNVMALFTQLRNSLDDAEGRDDIINRISDEVSTLFDANATLSNSNSEYITQNEQLRAANMKLFLQVGAQTIEAAAPQPKEKEERQPLKFEDLFNEKGELK